MEALLVGKLNITFLWSYPHVHGWITWINKWVAGSTKRNKALHLISLLKWLDSESITPASSGMPHTASQAFGKQKYNQSMTKAMNNNELVAAGNALHTNKQPTFILWLLDHVEHCSAPFQKSPQDTTSLAVKCYIQVLMEVFNSGYWQEIVSVNCLKWLSTVNTIEAMIPTEKLTCFKTDKEFHPLLSLTSLSRLRP
ncbi:uncharacterized protein ACA1_073540 [Acanthamoeba castellanii str. Neff]|uniref:Uncharacterized protein n=1 Tax=Acanthamoeba castellanii (strain ATCC 30010 / Neff) TaxID=1257118 RepID=L8HEX1_ACACF|nr:uncharacterized protein ACA1_073540 [Acanthamoeba castellanii str. Neff]ELR23710.1 hypothetical protein ACA1_073540 [Acanthamoeba castellanii str. Neff]